MYYKLKDLEKMVDLKPRSLKLRMLQVKKKYKFNTDLLYKNGNRWYIDETIVYEFDRKRNNLNDKEYKSFVTISFDGARSVEAINGIVNVVFDRLKPHFDKIVINYVIELNSSQKYHLHFITNIAAEKRNEIILYKLFDLFGIYFNMKKITNFRNLENYLNKDFVCKKTLKYQKQ
ncbi:MAG: hypothetical protein WCS03_15985 [Bacteroidota bacterium]